MEHKKKCEHCSKQFKSRRRDAKYCTANCRNKAAYERKFNEDQKEVEK